MANVSQSLAPTDESLQDLHTRHRREKRDLQSRITQKKKGASKKTRRGVNDECDELERQLKERQDAEIRTCEGDDLEDTGSEDILGIDDVPDLERDEVDPAADADRDIATPAEAVTPPSGAEAGFTGSGQKRNRAKEKLARRAVEQEAAVRAAEEEAANQPSQREIEAKVMNEEIKARNLAEKPIPPDGHCLFSAVADQLQQLGIPLDATGGATNSRAYALVRRAAADYIEQHPDDFDPYLEEPLSIHVANIRDTAEWGGHPELLALARTYNVEICVIQHPGPAAHIKPETGEVEDPPKIWLAYYRYGYGLGEHYNSLRKHPG